MCIMVNQTGYLPGGKKTAVSLKGGAFQVMDPKSGQAVYKGEGVYKGKDSASEDELYIMDFTQVAREGSYYLLREDGQCSYSFSIGDGVYKELKNHMIKALYYQRCGCSLEKEYAGIYAHGCCHGEPAVYYEDRSREKDMTGGWHDAGDYGRYATAGAVAVAHLLYAFQLFPEKFREETGIPESGNQVPDVLNECRYELEWLLKMQEETGGVAHKLTSERHANFVMPEEDHKQFLIFPVSSMATADFAAVMALASRIYNAYDEKFAKRAGRAAKKAFQWLLDNKDMKGFENPEGCNTGPYDCNSDIDDRLWAAAELLCTEDREEYRTVLKEMAEKSLAKTSMGWQDVSGLAAIAMLFDKKDSAGAIKEPFREAILREADRLAELSSQCGYGAAMAREDYVWGSNMVLTNRGMVLIIAYLLSGKKEYEEAALAQVHYLLGKNALGISYVTGHGENAVANPHNRPTVAAKLPVMPGWVSGGPNGHPCDEKAEWLILEETPPMKCFLDVWECYSLNEITIYWNSSAIFLISYFDMA